MLATWLKSMRHSVYFPTWVRRILGDFAISIAVVFMVGLDMYWAIETPKLHVPNQLQVSYEVVEFTG
jgi:hypothetical protein